MFGLSRFDYLTDDAPAPDTVNPILWRQSQVVVHVTRFDDDDRSGPRPVNSRVKPRPVPSPAGRAAADVGWAGAKETSPMSTHANEDPVPACGPDDLAVTVNWERAGPGLRGRVIAENVGARACRLANKPSVRPLRPDGSPLPVETIITLELRHPGYVTLQPGQRAASPVAWGSWCGEQASDRARVDWSGGSAVAVVHGPVQPECAGAPDNITSSWFNLIE
jgi:Protein of unknown function (DUF4232)